MEKLAYIRHYPCAECGQVGDEILNGHACTATNWPRGFFCSEACIERYKAGHPNWKRDRGRLELLSEHNCYMRQFVPKEDWERAEMTFDSESDRYLSHAGTFSPEEVLAVTERYKKDAAEKREAWLRSATAHLL